MTPTTTPEPSRSSHPRTEDELDPVTQVLAERRRVERIVMPRWLAFTVVCLAWLAIMVPLGFVLLYGYRADQRAERGGRTVCELALSNAQLAETLDAGLAVLVLDDGDREAARERLIRVVAEGEHTVPEAVAEDCGSGLPDDPPG